MKMFKRIASVILTAVLAAAVLTACGGGGGPAPASMEDQLKSAWLEMMDLSARKSGEIEQTASLERDTAMEAQLKTALEHIDPNGMIPALYRPTSDNPDSVSVGGTMHTYQTTQNGGYAIEVTAADLAAMQQSVQELRAEPAREFDASGEIWRMDGVAVATRTVNGKVYIATATRYKRIQRG